MRVLFVNPPRPQCGVHQYGQNLSDALKPSVLHTFELVQPESLDHLWAICRFWNPDALMYNWSPGIGGWLGDAPFKDLVRWHFAIYHAAELDFGKFDAVLFSDPTASREGNLFPIGRPMPHWLPSEKKASRNFPKIGVNGFCGAWAPLSVKRIVEEFDEALIRLHLPSATYGDSDGYLAGQCEKQCRYLCAQKPGIQIAVERRFLPTDQLLSWLSHNDLNCYIRELPPEWGRGVSSVLDFALAVQRPIAVNRCAAFRHVFDCSPSICVEDNSLRTIMNNGFEALRPLYSRCSPEVIRKEVEDVIAEITK